MNFVGLLRPSATPVVPMLRYLAFGGLADAGPSQGPMHATDSAGRSCFLSGHRRWSSSVPQQFYRFGARSSAWTLVPKGRSEGKAAWMTPLSAGLRRRPCCSKIHW